MIGTVSGFGSSVFFVPIAGMLFDFKTTLALTGILHIFSTSAQVFMFRKEINWKLMGKIGIPSVIFVIIGASLNDKADLRIAELAMGLFLIAFAAIMSVSSPKDTPTDKSFEENLPQTIFPSYKKAQEELNAFNTSWVSGSQCYNRSHIWSYESFLRNIIFKKAFLFFSDDYIERYDFPWWFHNSPFALVQMRENVEERVMDKAFSPYPLKFKLWTDLFMKNKVECAVVNKYSEYSQRPGTFDCFIIKTSEYFWQPKDLEAFETSGIEKKKFIDWEVAHAYKQGFGVE